MLKKLKPVIATWLIPKNFFKLFYSESAVNILGTHCQKYFSPHLNCHHHRDLTFTSAELRDLKLRGDFSSVARLTLSMLLFFIAVIESKISELVPSSIISKYFLNVRQGETEIDFNMFQFGKHFFQFNVRNWNCE